MPTDPPSAPRLATRLDYGRRIARAMALIAADPARSPTLEELAGGIGTRLPAPHPSTEETAMFDVTIRTEPGLRLAVLAHRGAYGAIGATFDRLNAWAAARGLVGAETRFIALYRDDPLTVPEAELRSEAGLTVPPGVEPGEGVRMLDLPPTRCAVLVFRGPYAELEQVYTWLYRDWLPMSGEEPADQPPREEYLNDPRSLPPAEWLTAVMLPLREKGAA